MSKTLMFDFITGTENPLGGDCYNCDYCYIHGTRGMKIIYPNVKKKYTGVGKVYENVLKRKFKEGDFIFFCDCIDYLHPKIHDKWIREIYEWIERSPKAYFLSLTKNPKRYLDFINEIPINIIVGCTIESNLNYPEYSKAPLQSDRIMQMKKISMIIDNQIFISCEPILKFTNDFINIIREIKPKFGVAIGYDNHKYRLYEPSLSETYNFIKQLLEYDFKVYRKTLRNAWWEK